MQRDQFKLELFEYVRATEETALLRLAGHWWGPGEAPAECDLLVVADGETDRLFALPQLPAAGEEWRAAYSVPTSLLGRDDAAFLLETPNGVTIDLPVPHEHGAAAPPPPPPAAPVEETQPEAGSGLIAKLVEERRARRTERELERERQQALDRERAARAEAQRLAAEERDRAERAAADLREALERATAERERFISWIDRYGEQRLELESELDRLHRELGEAAAAGAAV